MRLIKSELNGYYCPADPGEPFQNEKRLSISEEEARFISEFANDRIVLEIGTGLGVSTGYLAGKARWVHTVDIDPWVAENVILPENCTFYSDINDIDAKIDMAFVDGSHIEEHVTRDIEDCKRIVKKGGLLLFHDLNLVDVWNGIAKSGIAVTYLNIGVGIGFGWNE